MLVYSSIDADESKWERVKEQVRGERPQEFAPCYEKVTAPSRNTATSYDKPRSIPQTSHDFAPPKDYGNTRTTGPTYLREHGMVAGTSTAQSTTAKDCNSRTAQKSSTNDTIAQALSFFRNNNQK